ncbi:hypothetical protein E5082_22035 [Streptomyces griseoluteus]|uniref:EVE domain-containing protein n=1 Tax=Streptomyces griseoluteus TaxID=29306 RepID=A0A4Z1DCQ7_STRGP|nr:hypothetical protein [Streptomyces griseoluteus]TGN80092.1 hypothetical protein E5082_22035 [Streptomyces griseoluteus]GHE94389.1 hypothetical protein GCM10017776_08250 [Streptomyces griseoluteus]
MPSSHLLIIGDRAALSWVVTEQRMAFPAGRSKAARTLDEGDEIFLYTTRGCFRNPTRDLGRVIGRATLAGPVRALDEPVVFGERAFPEGCRLKVSGLAPFREGLVLRDLVPRLSVFPDSATWSVRMRRAWLTLPPVDADLVRAEVEPLLRPYGEAAKGYRWEAPVPG